MEVLWWSFGLDGEHREAPQLPHSSNTVEEEVEEKETTSSLYLLHHDFLLLSLKTKMSITCEAFSILKVKETTTNGTKRRKKRKNNLPVIEM